MSETPDNNRVTLERIHWREAFPFTQLFRTFRIAIHPSKLLLALAAVLVIYVGGRFMDLVAGRQVVVEQPIYTLRTPADEIQRYISAPTMAEFYRWRGEAQVRNDQRLEAALVKFSPEPEQAGELMQTRRAMDHLRSVLRQEQRSSLEVLNNYYRDAEQRMRATHRALPRAERDRAAFDQELQQLRQAYNYLRLSIWRSTRVADVVVSLDPAQAASQVIRPDPEAQDSAAERRRVQQDRERILRTVTMSDAVSEVEATRGLGVFQSALSYGILMFNSAIDSVLSAELFFNDRFVSFETTSTVPPGLVQTLVLAIQGLGWFVRVHWLYFIIFTLFSLLIWAIAGGAICRIAALHATRDEKIPLNESVSFAAKKFVSYFTAPLMPALFIIGASIPLLILGLIGAVPFIGELIVGLGFFVVLLISFVLALIIIGAVAGLGLLYPTISVEGSDTFDAFSRAYSYVYARPWRTIFYTLVAAVYGTLCFVFVKVLVGLVFSSASAIVGTTMNLSSAAHAAPLGKLEAMWFSPSLSGPFFGRFFLFRLSWTEALGSFFIALWVFILVGLVIAFAVSFFFSAYTIIYLLLRRDVDATELDEVFVEDFATEPAAVPATASGTDKTTETTEPPPVDESTEPEPPVDQPPTP